MAKAADTLTQPEAKPARDIIGGPYGGLSEIDMIKARKAYNNYVIETQSNGNEPVPFAEWATKQYKGQ